MRASENGHRIVAASVCFPSEWSLKEKFGRALADVHEPVPGLGRGTRNAGMIERIFGNLRVERPVERFNWFLLRNPALFLPELEYTKGGLFDSAGVPQIWLRVERQTLTRLPQTHAVCFTIRIHRYPLDDVLSDPATAEAFHHAVAQLSPEETAYKSLAKARHRL